ncbi:MAG TPA: DUF2231 domain-containing protein [Nocardioidaceae bacterium]|jgi:uncharacterized membrane protein|nr:DUF2231 domain-containing protein [Nocardioidaceae bacterium]
MNLATIVDRVLPRAGGFYDHATQTAQDKLARATENGWAASLAKGLHGNEWLGHPLHPVVIAVPIGAWSVTGWYDLVGALRGDPRDDVVADAALRVGVVGAVAAAATGVVQFLDTAGGVRRETAVHAGLNNVALALYLASMLARRGDNRALGRKLSAVALGLVGVSGYLGGDLSYRHGVGVHQQSRLTA